MCLSFDTAPFCICVYDGMDSKAVLVCICSLLNKYYRFFSAISAIFVTGKIL